MKDIKKNEFVLETIEVHTIQENPNNPRLIKNPRFYKLVDSIKKFPEMLNIRPIVIDENNMVLGGNMRYKAILHLKFKEVIILRAIGLTEDQKNQFIIKDNNHFGEWDIDILANNFDREFLLAMGMEEKELKFFLDEFEQEFYKTDDSNADLPIVAKFGESYNAVTIFCNNDMDWNWIKSVFELGKERDYKSQRIKESQVVSVQKFQQIWKKK
jgi:hypothetical protein